MRRFYSRIKIYVLRRTDMGQSQMSLRSKRKSFLSNTCFFGGGFKIGVFQLSKFIFITSICVKHILKDGWHSSALRVCGRHGFVMKWSSLQCCICVPGYLSIRYGDMNFLFVGHKLQYYGNVFLNGIRTRSALFEKDLTSGNHQNKSQEGWLGSVPHVTIMPPA